MGVTVRQKTKGKGQPWWVFISHDGKRTSRKVGDKKAADAVASKIRAKLQLGEFGFGQKKKRIPLFKDYAVDFLETYSAMNHKESTTESYESVLRNHVNPAIGDKQLDEITKQDIKDLLLQKRKDGLSPATVKLIKAYTASIFECAVGDDELIDANPVRSLGKKTQEILKGKNDEKKDINPYSRDELKKLMDTAKTEFPNHYTLLLLLARTGMRAGEALGLKWGEIDFNGKFIEVSRQYSKGRIDVPKNGKTRRVDISNQLAQTLKQHLLKCKKKGLALGLGEIPKYVFTNEKGGLIDLHGWRRRVFKKAIKKAELREIRVHDIRHSYATIRISEGHDIIDVSHQLGHHSEAFTLRVYNHWKPGKRKSEVNALDDQTPMNPSAPYVHPGKIGNKK